jgi:uncharacterized coiled-coil protein SlyX
MPPHLKQAPERIAEQERALTVQQALAEGLNRKLMDSEQDLRDAKRGIHDLQKQLGRMQHYAAQADAEMPDSEGA